MEQKLRRKSSVYGHNMKKRLLKCQNKLRNLVTMCTALPIEGALTDRNEAVENIENNMAMAMTREANGGKLKMLNRQDNGEDCKTKST